MAASSSYLPLAQNEHQANAEKASLLGHQQQGLGLTPAPRPLDQPYAALAKEEQWSTDLFDICGQPGGTGLCCCSLWCPCVQYGRIVSKLPQVSTIASALSKDPDGVICGGSERGGCLAFFLLSFAALPLVAAIPSNVNFVVPCNFPLHLQLRVAMRKKYGLQGDLSTDMLLDCLTVFFCQSCSLCQLTREQVIRQAVEQMEVTRASLSPPPQQVLIYSAPNEIVHSPPVALGAAYGIPVTLPASTPAAGVPVPQPGKHD